MIKPRTSTRQGENVEQHLSFDPPEHSIANVRHRVDEFLVTVRSHEHTSTIMVRCWSKRLAKDSALLVFEPLPGQEAAVSGHVHQLALEFFAPHNMS